MRAKTFSGWSLGWLLGALLAAPAAAQEQIPLVTYGPQASPGDGDDDFRQEILLRVPAAVTGELYLRLFDADCGGGLDDSSGPFDTRTRFRLLAPGDGATIASRELGVDAFHDGVWTTLASFYPEAFAADGDERVFKLVVEGLTGDDANVYHLALSRSGKRNLPPPGLRATVAGPTVRLPRAGVRGEIRFFVPAGVGELRVRSYDLAGARIHLETRWRSQLPLASSGQAEWAESTVALAPDESGHLAAVVFAGGGEIPNDATFEVSAGDGRPLPVELPLYLWQRNHRPLPRVGTLALADCRTVVFDGSASSDADGDALEFFWDFGDGARGRGRRTAHAYEAPGRYRARLLLEDASGQVGSSSRLAFDAVLNAPPTAAAGDDLVGVPGAVLRLDAGASADADGEIVRTLWDLGDGTRAESPSVEHAWSEPGTYLVKLRVEDDSESPCNFATDEAVVWINAPPVVDAGPDRIASPGRTLAFERRRGEDSDGEIVRWEWDFGDGTSLRGRPVEHAWAAPGTYEVTLTVTDDAAAANSTASDRLRVRVNDPPAAAAGPDRRVAVGEPIRFDAGGSLDRDGEIIARRWQFGDGAEAAGVEVSHAFAEPGRYRVTLTVRDDSASTSDTAADVAEVIVNHPPAARAGDDQHLTASAVTFDGRASGDADGEIIAWRWDFGDGATSSEAAPVHVYRSPGTYRVRLVVTDDSGTSSRQSSDELAVVVNAAPIADAGGDRVTAPGRTLRFAADASVDPDGTVVAWAWDFGDGTDATGAAVEHAWERPGTYTVRLRVSDDSGHPLAVGYDQATVVVNRAPVARAGPDRRVAPGDEVTFDGRGSYDLDGGTLTYRWEIDGGGTSERATLRHRFEEPGIYTARLTVDDGSGTLNAETRDELTIAVNHPPRARPGDDVMTCDAVVELDGAASVDADGDPLSYRWNFGDGTPEVSGMRGRHTFAGGGTFPVVLTVDDGSGLANSRDAAALTVTINEPPSADAGEDRTVCTGDPVLLSAAGSTDPENGLLKYRWDFGNGEAAEGLNPSTRYREGGVYRVTLTVTDDSGLPCNTAVDGLVLRVAESPVADAGEDRTVCANAAVRLDGSRSRDFTDGVVDSFWWDFGDGSTGGGAGPVHVFKQPGTYRVTLDVTGDPVGDCDNTGSDAIMLTVLEAPVAELSAPEATPVGVPVTFDAAASSGSGREITARQWDFGDGTMAAGPTVSHTFATHGKYPVTLTVSTDADGACRSATTHRFLVVNAPPRAGAGSDRLVGVAEPVTFSGAGSVDPDGEITAYRWDFGDGTTASGPQVRHRWQRSGRYPVTLSVIDDTELANREHSTTIEVTVNAAPQPVIDGPDRACEGEEVAWTAGASEDPDGEIIAFAWDFGDGEAAEGREVSHTYREPGRYQLELSVDDGTAVSNRRALATRTVTVNRPPTAAPLPERIVCPGDEVRFNGSAAVDPDGEIHAWRWDFGDGAQGRGAEVSHVYARPGRHQVTLEVDDGTGTTCAVARERATVVVNASPEPDAGGDRKTFVGGAHDAVFFDAGGSSDPDGDPLTYLWDFGDDTSAAGVQVRHTYPEPGSYTVRLIVRDGTGTACGEAVAELRVEAGGPTLPPSRAGLDSQSMCCGFRSLECYLGMMSCRFGVWSEHKTERDAVPGSTEVNLSGFAGFRL